MHVASPTSAPPNESVQRFASLLLELGFVTETQLTHAFTEEPATGNRLGEDLVAAGALTRSQLQRALSIALSRGDAIVLDRPPLGEVLIGLGALEPAQLHSVLEHQRRNGRRLGELLVERGLVPQQVVFDALGVQARMAHTESTDERRPRRVMVIDDSRLACSLIDEGLTRHGFDVITFTDPLVALEQLPVVQPMAIVSGLSMHGIDAAELCRRLKSGAFANVPVIILTASEPGSPAALARLGAADSVSKGATMEELAARIDAAMQRTRELDRVRRVFTRATSDAGLEELLKAAVVLSGELRQLTVVSVAVKLDALTPNELDAGLTFTALNAMLDRACALVLERGGLLLSVQGDALLAGWGAPIRHDDDVEAAASAALAIAHQAPGTLGLGLGVATGPSLMGLYGSARRNDYSAAGEPVTLARHLSLIAAPGDVFACAATATALARVAPLEPLAPTRLHHATTPVPRFRIGPQLEPLLRTRRPF